MTTTQEFWEGNFGDEYTDRNRVNWLDRVPFWTDIIARTGIRSAVELGANVGWNLMAIRTVCLHILARGVDYNECAVDQARALGLDVYPGGHGELALSTSDLAFTAGVLIHIHPDDITWAMESIISASRRYVLAVEYESETEEEVEYRGHAGKLWRRPYGKMYQHMGLKLIASGEARGFDRCTYWLLEKPQ